MNKPYNVILFDVDGTLVDTDELIYQTFVELYKKYYPLKKIDRSDTLYFSGPPIKETLLKEFKDVPIDVILKEYHDIAFTKYEATVTLFKNVKETLEILKNNNIKIGVITNKLHETTEYCFSLLNILSYFPRQNLICSNDVKIGKPNKESFFKAKEVMNIKNSDNILYVGDNLIDLEFANNAGIDSAIVTYTNRKLDFTNKKPTYLIKDFLKLRELI